MPFSVLGCVMEMVWIITPLQKNRIMIHIATHACEYQALLLNLLLENGASTRVKSNDGKTPADLVRAKIQDSKAYHVTIYGSLARGGGGAATVLLLLLSV